MGVSKRFAMREKWPILETLQSCLIGLMAFAAGCAPLAVPALLVGTSLVTAVQDKFVLGTAYANVRSLVSKPAAQLTAVLLIYALTSSLWARESQSSLVTVLQASAVLIACFYLASSLDRALRTLSRTRKTRFTRALPWGALFVGIYFTLDYLTKEGLTLAIANNQTWLFEGDKTSFVYAKNGHRIGIRDDYFNRIAMAVVLLLPAVTAMLSFWPKRSWRVLLQIVATLGAALICLRSGSQTAWLALAGGLFFAALALVRSKIAILALQVLLLILAIFAIPLAKLPKALNLDQMTELPASFRQRVLIWNDVAHLADDKMLSGIGVESVRYGVIAPHIPKDSLSKVWLPKPAKPAGVAGAVAKPSSSFAEANRDEYRIFHPHNGYLQVWLELGVIGALLFAASGISLLDRLSALPHAIKPYAVALGAGSVLSLATGWGVWQPWLIGANCLGWLCLLIASREFEPSTQAPDQT